MDFWSLDNFLKEIGFSRDDDFFPDVGRIRYNYFFNIHGDGDSIEGVYIDIDISKSHDRYSIHVQIQINKPRIFPTDSKKIDRYLSFHDMKDILKDLGIQTLKRNIILWELIER